jgi:hypothetical protein
MGSPHFPKKTTRLTRNRREIRSTMSGSCNLFSNFVLPKQYTGMIGTPCLMAMRMIPFRTIVNSSSGCVRCFGYPSNISAIPPGANPIREPSDKARSTDGRDASLLFRKKEHGGQSQSNLGIANCTTEPPTLLGPIPTHPVPKESSSPQMQQWDGIFRRHPPSIR